MIQQFGLNIQAELHANWLLEIGYVGTRGTHLLRTRSANQALDASTADPIRGPDHRYGGQYPTQSPDSGCALRSAFRYGVGRKLLVQRPGG